MEKKVERNSVVERSHDIAVSLEDQLHVPYGESTM